MTQEYKKVLNGYGVLVALYIAKRANKNPGTIITALNESFNQD